MIGKLWLKFENIINKIINLIINTMCSAYQKITPDRFQKNINEKSKIIINKINNFLNKFQKNVQRIKPKSKPSKNLLKEKFKNIQISLSNFIEYTRHINIKTISFKTQIIKLINVIKQLINIPITYIKKQFKNLDNNTIILLILGPAFILFIILGIFKSGSNIYQGVQSHNKNPIIIKSIKRPKVRESYFKRILPAKQLSIQEITLPIYIDSINSVRTLLIDLTLVTSNRYTKKYLSKYSYLVKDRLNNTIHPIIPDFPLTLEGKTIIREKVIYEINKLLKEQKIEGEIKQVNFQTIIAA